MREGDCWLFMIFAVIKIQWPLILREKIVVEKEKTILEDRYTYNDHFKRKLEIRFYRDVDEDCIKKLFRHSRK